MAPMFCPTCGKQLLLSDQKFCAYCGGDLGMLAEGASPSSSALGSSAASATPLLDAAGYARAPSSTLTNAQRTALDGIVRSNAQARQQEARFGTLPYRSVCHMIVPMRVASDMGANSGCGAPVVGEGALMSNLRRLAVLTVALLLAGCGSPSSTSSPAPVGAASASPLSTSSGAPAWSVPDSVRSSADAGIVGVLAAVTSPPSDPRYVVRAIRQQGDWALVMISDGDPQMAAEGGFAIAVRVDGQWKVIQATDTAAFCAALERAPAGALSADERDYFMGCK